jgi:hypothetical protein
MFELAEGTPLDLGCDDPLPDFDTVASRAAARVES